jgi:hypothetical protein
VNRDAVLLLRLICYSLMLSIASFFRNNCNLFLLRQRQRQRASALELDPSPLPPALVEGGHMDQRFRSPPILGATSHIKARKTKCKVTKL